MKNALHITTTLDHPDLLKNLVEKLAWRRCDAGSDATGLKQRKLIDTSSTETYVSGTIVLMDEDDNSSTCVNMPFITCFLFTCKKEDKDSYNIEWSISLS